MAEPGRPRVTDLEMDDALEGAVRAVATALDIRISFARPVSADDLGLLAVWEPGSVERADASVCPGGDGLPAALVPLSSMMPPAAGTSGNGRAADVVAVAPTNRAVIPIVLADGKTVGVLLAEDVDGRVLSGRHIDALRALSQLVAEARWEQVRREQFQRRAAELDAAIARRRGVLLDLIHDLRAPLAVIAGAAQLAATGIEGYELELIGANAAHMEAAFDGLLDAEAHEFGAAEEPSTEVDLAELLGAVAAATRVLLGSRPVEVAVEGEARMWTQPVRLRRLLLNLASNAARHTRTGRIVFSCAQDETGTEVVVADTGAGLGSGDVDRYSQEFIRGEASSGFGLGLPIVRRLAGLLGASVSAAGQPGEGTTFRLRFGPGG